MAATGAAAFSLGGAAWFSSSKAPLSVLAHPGLLSLFGNTRTVRNLGRTYRSAFPNEDGANVLSHALLFDAGLSRHSAEGALHDQLDQNVRNDFVRGNVVELSGWILSRTEARQCALYSILYP